MPFCPLNMEIQNNFHEKVGGASAAFLRNNKSLFEMSTSLYSVSHHDPLSFSSQSNTTVVGVNYHRCAVFPELLRKSANSYVHAFCLFFIIYNYIHNKGSLSYR